MSGGGGQSTSTQPWKEQRGYLADIFGQAQNLYQQGPQEYYPGATVAPLSDATQQGISALQQSAQGSPQQAAMGSWLGNTLGQGNVNPWSIFDPAQQAAGGLGAAQQMLGQAGQPGSYGQAAGMAGVGGQPFTGAGGLAQAMGFSGSPQPGAMPAATNFLLNQLAGGPQGLGQALNRAGGTIDPAATGQLRDTAGGAFLGSNPYLDDMYQDAAKGVSETFNEQIMPGLNAQFGSAGRTGSGTQALMSGRAAGDAADALAGLSADIYAPAYEAERGRQQQAAGQLGQLGLGTGQLGSDFLRGQQQGAGLAGDLFSRGEQADLGRRGLAGEMFLGAGQQDIGRRGMAADIYTGGLDRQLAAGQGLGQLGLGGLGAMSDLQGNLAQQQYQAGTLTPAFQGMQQQNMQNLLNAGAMTEDQQQRMMDDAMQRWNFSQQAPWQNLSQYANMINQLPGGYGTTSESGGGSRLQGALGGAAAGSALGPWGTAGGALLGGLFGG